MRASKIILVLALALTVSGAQAQNRRPRKSSKARTTATSKKKLTDWKGTGAGVYDLDADLPEDAAVEGSKVVKKTTSRTVSGPEKTLIPSCEIDEKNVLQATASSALDKVEICDKSGKVLRSQGMHRQTKASLDLNNLPKDQTLVFKFYGVDGNTQNIELSHK